ncbi:F-box/WD repeat-containing protein 1A, partial [Varanus komodoensis]
MPKDGFQLTSSGYQAWLKQKNFDPLKNEDLQKIVEWSTLNRGLDSWCLQACWVDAPHRIAEVFLMFDITETISSDSHLIVVLSLQCSMPRSLWLGCSSLADSMPSLRCLYNPGTGALTAFQNSSEREDCNNDEPPRKIIPEKNALRQTYNSCARLCLNQEAVCLGNAAVKTENCVAKEADSYHSTVGATTTTKRRKKK